MIPLPQAKKIWDSPSQMVAEWYSSEDKLRQEKLVADLVGPCGKLADVGCGVGRFSEVMKYQSYQGYDLSTQMIAMAKVRNGSRGKFSCVDAVYFSSDEEYDTLISIDTAIHQTDPVAFINRIITNFQAKRYIFTVLVSEKHQNLFATTVLSVEEAKELRGRTLYTERVKNENFDWVIYDFTF